MKKKYLLFILFFPLALLGQNNKTYDYSQFDISDLQTDLFIKQTSPFSILNKKLDSYGMYQYTQTYKEIFNNDTKHRLLHLKKIQQISKPINYSHIVKIGFLHIEHESINHDYVKNGKLTLNGNKVLRNTTEYVFTKNTTTIISPICKTHKGLATTYILEKDFFLNNTPFTIIKIEADFDKSIGFQQIFFNTPYPITYTNEGKKNLTFKIHLNNGDIITRKSIINIELSKQDLNNLKAINATETISTITADLSMYSGASNFAGLAEYEVFLGADNSLDKPIFIIDGFDPGDGRDINAVYDLLSYDNSGTPENLGDRIRADEDFDVVIINLPQYFRLSDNSLLLMANATDTNTDGIIDIADYPGSNLIDGGADFIERNAMTVVEIINEINAQKTGTKENVIIGPSMGGLISRYALNYMEQQNLLHETRLWVSFDSPHRGANVPIGFQQVFNFLAYGLGGNSVESIKPIVDNLLKSAAAKQMLVDHFEPHLASGSPDDFDTNIVLPTAHDYHNSFFNNINILTSSGFPETTRNVTMINGSGVNTPYSHKDGSPVLPENKILDVFLTQFWPNPDLDLDVWCTPYANNQTTIGDQYIDMPWPISNEYSYAESKAHSYSNGVDAASGGLFDLTAIETEFNDGTDPTISAFFDGLQVNNFNFIPSVSALALNNSDLNWFESINLGVGDMPWDGTTTTNSQTPFVNWFMPINNEDHVTLTTANVDFAWSEIVEPHPLQITENEILINNIELLENPTNQNINLKSSLPIGTVLDITLIDLIGKIAHQTNRKAEPLIHIQTKVATGLYLLNIKDKNNNILLHKKLLINN